MESKKYSSDLTKMTDQDIKLAVKDLYAGKNFAEAERLQTEVVLRTLREQTKFAEARFMLLLLTFEVVEAYYIAEKVCNGFATFSPADAAKQAVVFAEEFVEFYEAHKRCGVQNYELIRSIDYAEEFLNWAEKQIRGKCMDLSPRYTTLKTQVATSIVTTRSLVAKANFELYE